MVGRSTLRAQALQTPTQAINMPRGGIWHTALRDHSSESDFCRPALRSLWSISESGSQAVVMINMMRMEWIIRQASLVRRQSSAEAAARCK